MKQLFIFGFISILISVNTHLSAQEKKWTLKECMQYAVDNSLKKEKQEAQNKIYKQHYQEAVANLLPSVSGSTNAYFNFGRGLDGTTNSYVDLNSFSNNYELYSSITLFNGLSNITKIKMQKMNRLTGGHKLQEIIDMVAYETMEAYIAVVYYKEMIKLAEEQLTRSKESLHQVKRMEELGVKSFPDVTEMQAKEAADNYNLTRQKNLLTIGIIKLKEKMNFPIEDKLDISDEVPEVNIAKTPESPLSIFEQSKAYLPKTLATEATYRSQELSLKTTRGSLFPTLTASGGVNTNFFRYMDGGREYLSFKDQFKDKRGSYVGFSLSIPIFNNLNRSSNTRRSKYQLEIAEKEKDENMRAIHSEIEQAVADMNGQADEYFQAVKQSEFMYIAHQANIRKYNEGLISPLELHTSEDRLFQAQVEELNSRLTFHLKQRLVNYYKGEPFITENK